MSIPAKITTRRDSAGWVAEVVTLEFDRCVFSTMAEPRELDAITSARHWVEHCRRDVYDLDSTAPQGGLTVDIFDLEDFDLRR
jgi:hypothetical protein